MKEDWQLEEQLFLNHGNERETNGSGRRYFSRGGVKYALLELLEQESMHGYQMMKALEDQSGGTYKPSAGSIYPTLQMLRDQGFVEASKLDGKKVFHITDAGRTYLLEEKNNTESTDNGYDRREQGDAEEENGACDRTRRNRRLTPKGKELLHLLKAAERAAMSNGVKAIQLRTILENLRFSLRQLSVEPENGSEEGES
ncbi:PadR family transcriptional regulator [Paenibacillus prosopidis]|uniref:DNA-binding PadR family transcriptional regulator n=1 Tax=Paenibacillus prosopidis TaxID=630520 RepID=A0A368W296_9BACL|nr:PadR family transcriptional regulator [Paenibacillus prosopidis]RCW47388.1 DNA-binding PadR family transcriptional regulator [Paenibacillus prosopidis]